MSNTEQATEPTMEEILSSIRKIISDDDQEEAPSEAKPEAAAEPEPEPEAEPDDDPGDDIFELTEVVTEETPVEEAPAEEALFDGEAEEEPAELIDPDSVDDLEFVAAEPEPEPEDAFAAEPEPSKPEVEYAPVEERPLDADSDGLLSAQAGDETSAAFGQLAETLLSRNGATRTLEDLVQDMLRPMLKGWLDENLPAMVERLVREEIERVSRRR